MRFKFNPKFSIDTEKSPWKTEGLRVGLWGGSGSGKSSTAALLAEQFLTQGGVLVVFEPRAEYQTLKEKFDVVVIGGPYGKDLDFVPSSPATYAKAVVQQGVSLIFYTSDVEDEVKLIEFISKFLRYLLKYNEIAKRPIMVTTEETEEYAPLTTKGRVAPPWVFSRMTRQFRVMSRDARKLNIVPVYISPRPQEINFTIRQLCNLTFFGKFSPQDASYVDRECLRHYKHSFYRGKDLLDLKTGQFAVILSGKSLPLQEITEPRQTKHGAETPKLEYVAPRSEETQKAVTDLTETIRKALEKERLELSELEKEKRKTKKLETDITKMNKEIEKLNTALEVAGKIKIENLQGGVSPGEFAVVKAERDKLQRDMETIVADIKKEVLWVFKEYSNWKTFPLKKPVQLKAGEPLSPEITNQIYEVWAPKMPSLCAKRIFKFLLDRKNTKYTKSQLGVALGYKTTSGTFNGALSFLKQNNLIEYDGRYFWVE